MNDGGIYFAIALLAIVLTVLVVPFIRFGIAGAPFNAHFVRKLGRFSGMCSETYEFNIEISELRSSGNEVKVGTRVSCVNRAPHQRTYISQRSSFTKEEALEFARLLRKAARAAEETMSMPSSSQNN